jgi:hypothetical protein
MNPYIIASAFTLLSPSGGEMPSAFSPETKQANLIGVEQCGTETQQANLIEVAQRGTENVAFITYSMDKQADKPVNERLAVNKSAESRGIAFLPQVERTPYATVAVYQDNQGKQASALDFSVRTPDQVAVSIEWANDTHAFTSERSLTA